MADGQRTHGRRADSGHCRQRHHLVGQGRAQIEIVQAFGLAALLRIQFQHDLVLVDLGLEFTDLPLAEGVVECLIDIGGGQSET